MAGNCVHKLFLCANTRYKLRIQGHFSTLIEQPYNVLPLALMFYIRRLCKLYVNMNLSGRLDLSLMTDSQQVALAA